MARNAALDPGGARCGPGRQPAGGGRPRRGAALRLSPGRGPCAQAQGRGTDDALDPGRPAAPRRAHPLPWSPCPSSADIDFNTHAPHRRPPGRSTPWPSSARAADFDAGPVPDLRGADPRAGPRPQRRGGIRQALRRTARRGRRPAHPPLSGACAGRPATWPRLPRLPLPPQAAPAPPALPPPGSSVPARRRRRERSSVRATATPSGSGRAAAQGGAGVVDPGQSRAGPRPRTRDRPGRLRGTARPSGRISARARALGSPPFSASARHRWRPGRRRR